MDAAKLFSFIEDRSAEIINAASLRRKLVSRRDLRVKLGVDPTTPDLHLGHVVPLRLLKVFQDAGHRVVLIIGDFTAQIGDPAGKSAVRRQLTPAEAKANERTYRRQIGRVLDLHRVEVRHNREWFDRMKLADFLGLLARFPLKGAWERADFQRRLRAGKAVQLHEAMYHVLQAFDSVAVRADIEIGGADQRLNLLAGRELQSRLGRIPQDIVLLPYLVGLDGKQKMSKTAGNTINLQDSAADMFGKVMSIPDAAILNYAAFAAWMEPASIRALERRRKAGENPRDAKLEVAGAIVRLYHGASSAKRARGGFLELFSRREAGADLPTTKVKAGAYSGLRLLEALQAVPSRSEGRRLLNSGAVEVDGHVVREAREVVHIRAGSIVRVGKKKFFRIR